MTSGAYRSLMLKGRIYILILPTHQKALQQTWEVWRIRKIILMEICWSCYLGNSISISASRSSSSLSTGRKVHQICAPLRMHGQCISAKDNLAHGLRMKWRQCYWDMTFTVFKCNWTVTWDLSRPWCLFFSCCSLWLWTGGRSFESCTWPRHEKSSDRSNCNSDVASPEADDGLIQRQKDALKCICQHKCSLILHFLKVASSLAVESCLFKEVQTDVTYVCLSILKRLLS